MNMKTYYIDIDDVTEEGIGMDAISLVEFPAVERNFLKFAQEQPRRCNFDEAKRIITGVSLLADTPIYRYDPVEYGEHYVVFTKEVILKIVELYSKKNLFNSLNLQHDNNKPVENVYLIESYVVDRERGVVPEEFADVPDGSWITSFKVENEELWKELTSPDSKFNGFSIQGLFQYKDKPEEISNPTFDDWIDSFFEKKKIVLISCVKTKEDTREAIPAKDLYISPLFKESLEYAYSLNPDKIYIISAKYGLLKLTDKIKPYNLTLKDFSADERKEWSEKILTQLKHAHNNIREDNFIILAGEVYYQYLIDSDKNDETKIKHYKLPLEGLPLGERVSELKDKNS